MTANIVSTNSRVTVLEGNIVSINNTLVGVINGAFSYGNANVATYLPQYNGNLTAGNVTISGSLFVTGNITTQNYETISQTEYANSIIASGNITASGNVRAGNVQATTAIYANAYYWYNNGAPFSSSTYSNTNVGQYLPTYSGNSNAAFFTGNGYYLTGITSGSTYSNTNVGYYLNSNLITSTISLTGNVIANAHYGNSYLYSNGVSILTGISGTYGNTQVGYYLNSNLITSTVSITGNVIANAHYGNSFLYSNGSSIIYSNSTVASYLSANLFTSNIAITGNVIANAHYGNSYLYSNGVNILSNISISGNINLTSNNYILGDFTNSTVAYRTLFQTANTNSSTGIYALPSGSSTAASWQAANSTNPTNASKILIATNGSTDVQLVSGINGTGTYLPLSFYNNGAAQMVLYPNGNINMSNANPITTTGNVSVGNLIVSGAGYIYGNASVGTLTNAANGVGYMGMPQNSQSGSTYAVAIGDAVKHLYFTSATVTATIPANSATAFPIGTTIAFVASSATTLTIAITTDTMYLAGTGTTGSRTLAAYGMATAVKVAATTWFISGIGLT